MTLMEYLEMWLETYIQPNRAKKTVDAYRYALAHLSGKVRAMELHQLTPLHLQREINALSARYSRQAQLMFIALRAALARAARLGLIEHSPMELCDPPSHEKAEIKYLTAPEAAAYVRCAAEAAGADRRCRLLILMLCLGLRRNEARGLKCGDMDAEGVLHIRQQRAGNTLAPLKSRASKRDIPVPEALRAFFEGEEGEYIADCSETALRRRHVAILAAARISSPVTLHGLRHSCATLAMQTGGQLTTIQRLLGHAHFSVTADTYIHVDLASLSQTTKQIFSVIRSPIYGEGARLEIV